MSDKVFSLEAELLLAMDDFSDGLNEAKEALEEIGENTETVAKTAKLAFGSFVAGFALEVVKGIGDIIPASVQAAAEIQAMDAQFDAAFGDMSEQAIDALKEIGEETNIVSRRLKTVGTKAFSQFAGSGMDSAEALKETELYLRLAADAAAYYDMSLEDVDERLRSFIRGNTEAGDMIGLYTSASQRDSKALELYGTKWEKLNEEQRQYLMLHVADEIYSQTGALGQAAREADNYNNLLENMNALRYEILGNFGAPILEALTPIMQEFNDWLGDNPETIEALSGTVAQVVAGLLDVFKSAISWFTANEDTIIGITDALSNLFGGANVKTSGEIAFDSLAGYSEDAYELLHNLIEANNQLTINKKGSQAAVDNAFDALFENAEALSLYSAYGKWQKENASILQGLLEEEMPYLPAEVYLAEGSQELMQDQLNRLQLSASVTLVPNVGAGFTRAAVGLAERLWSFGSGSADGSHDTGLPYVPYDGYMAELHQGERVLTSLQNAQYSQQEPQERSKETDADELAHAFLEAISGLTIQMDKQTVGTIVSPVVFREMGRQLGSKRFAT